MRLAVAGLALLAGAFALAGCATSQAYPDLPGPGQGTLEVRRIWHEGREGLKRRYTVLVYESGLVEKHGSETEWYRSGALRMEREWDHDRPTGVMRTWFEDGARESEIDYGDGRARAPMRWWHPNGQLAAAGTGIAGVRDGPWTYWYPSGRLARRGAFAASLREGPWTIWNEDGTKQAEGAYEAGRRVGAWTLWDEHGRPVTREVAPERPRERDGAGQ